MADSTTAGAAPWPGRTITLDRRPGGITIAEFGHFGGDDASSMLQLKELCDLFAFAASDEATAVLVLSGANRNFFSGPNLSAIAAMRQDPNAILHEMATARRTLLNILDLEKPVIAAVSGAAVGVGTTVALLCDLVIVTESAIFQDPHVPIGVAAGDGGCVIWPMLVGMAVAKRYLLLGHRMSGAVALHHGIATEMVDEESLAAVAEKYAAKLASMPQFALRATKSALNQWLRSANLASGDYASALQLASQFTPDARDAIDRLANRAGRASAI